jgi:hypothetical protein
MQFDASACLRALTLATLFFNSRALKPADCNGNGVDDAIDIPQNGFSFAGPPRYPVPGGPRAIVTADLDGDGDADVAASSAQGTVSVFVQHGGGALGKPTDYQVSLCCASSSLVAADLDRDGDLDLAMGQDSDDLNTGVAALRNLGDGSFEISDHVGGTGRVRAIAAADLDDDGDLDIATTGEFKVSLFFNRGDAKLEPPREIVVGSNPFAIVAGDFDANGRADLATGNALFQQDVADNVSVFINLSAGEFEAPRNFGVGEGLPAIAARDIDHDGKLDIVVTNNVSNTVTGLIGDGSGGFARKDLLALSGPIPGQGPALALVVEDLDEDGDLDLAVTSPLTNHLEIAFQDAMGVFGDSRPILADSPLGTRLQALSAADIDGDKDPDLIAAHFGQSGRGGGFGSLTPFLNLGGEFTMGRNRTITVQDPVYFVTIADLNADGRLDMITNSNDNVSVFLQGESAEFPDAVSYAFGGSSGEDGNPMKVADLDGDGDLDLAASDGYPEGRVSVLLNEGDGHYENASHYPTRSITPIFLITADLDVDGALDLATANLGWNGATYGAGPELSVLRNLGDGTFAPGVGYQSGVTPNGASFVVAGDFNEDGSLDLAVSIYGPWNSATGNFMGNGKVAVFLNDGQGTFLPPRNQEVDSKPGRLILADFDADGHIDMVTAGTTVLWGDGTGAFPRVSDHSAISDVATDLDGDGTIDLAGNCGGAICVLFGSAGVQFRDGREYPVDADADSRLSSPVIAADLNGDGRSELVATFLAPDGSGGMFLLLNSGDRTFAPKSFTIWPSPDLLGPQWVTSADLNRDLRLDLLTANLGTDDPNHPGGSVTLLFNLPEVSTSIDRNDNGVPDECERMLFHRGDPNDDGTTDLSDGIAVFNFLFLGGKPTCMDSTDANGDGNVDLSDGIFLLNFLFLGGPTPAAPGPAPDSCGSNSPDSPSNLGCLAYNHCL